VTRTLPDADPTIDGLDPAARAVLADVWTRRMAAELGAGGAFAVVERELAELGAEPVVLALARRAVADEPRHAELCRRLAEAYAGAPVAAAVPPDEVAVPRHDGADPVLRRHLHVVAMCCINESIACAFVEACLADADGPLVRAIHREHLADEIQHARVGWAHLGSARVDAATKAAIAAWLPRLLDANLRHWEHRIGLLPAAGVPGHALPPVATLVAAARAAVEAIVLPGFDHVGIDTRAARAWFSAYNVTGGL
jgi:hypothetical protein